MFSSWKKAAAIWIAALSIAKGQGPEITYLGPEAISEAWTYGTSSVRDGNGVFVDTAGTMAVVVSLDCAVAALNPSSGVEMWKYTSTNPGAQCFGGAFFSTDYIVFAESTSTESKLVALSKADGTVSFETPNLPGLAPGTPVTTEDGKYVITTANSDNKSVGHFVVYDRESLDAPTYIFTDPEQPFGAVGYYWRPEQGYFEGGYDNFNDVFIWMYDRDPLDASVGTGQIYAFQFPTLPTTPLNVTAVGISTRPFQSPHEPVLTNGGLSMYWAVTRNEQRVWADGRFNLFRRSFDKGNLNTQSDFGRNPIDPGAAAKATPVLSSDSEFPTVYGPTFTSQIFRMNYDYSELLTVDTFGTVCSRMAVSPNDAYVYYATPSPDNKLYQLDGTTLATIWTSEDLGAGIEGDIAQSRNGDIIIAADILGTVRGFKVADVVSAPTISPTASPTEEAMESDAPTPAVPVASDAPTPGGTPGEPGTDAPTTEPDDGDDQDEDEDDEDEPTPSPVEGTTPSPVDSATTPSPTAPDSAGTREFTSFVAMIVAAAAVMFYL